MKKIFSIVTFSIALINAAPAVAAAKTVKLSVPGMTCPVCPVTVKKALGKVKGVNAVSVSFDSKMAVVSFDDVITSGSVLTHATADAGYPSSVMKSGVNDE